MFVRIDKSQLVSDMKSAVVEIIFIKDDGTPRNMKCTLNKIWFPPEYQTPDKIQMLENSIYSDSLALPVFDVQVGGWRTVPLDRVLFLPQAINW